MDHEPPHLYQQIAESLRRRIATGELKPGDRVQPVRAMAREWRCTPGTVSRAYKTLAREGLLLGQRGRGTLVAPGPIQAPDAAWGWAALVNHAERFLLEAQRSGHSPIEVETALSVAAARLNALQSGGEAAPGGRREAARKSVRFTGSHDLLIDVIARMASEVPRAVPLAIEYAGSLGGLIALAQDSADIAGVHLWDEVTETYNTPFVRRLLPGRRVVLVTLAHRRLGLILPSGNPGGIQELQDLQGAGVRFVNRQPGSGTRVWLDAQLSRQGIHPDSIAGYDRAERTHLGVASAIAAGKANAGLGIFAAASSFGLDFIPLTEERYDLVIPARVWELPEIQAIAGIVRSPHLKAAVEVLGGYDTHETGREEWVP